MTPQTPEQIAGKDRWEVGQHPAIANGWIVRPVLFGSRVRVLPECEGGAVLIKSEADARLIAAAPDLLDALVTARIAIIALADRALEAGFGPLADILDQQLTKANDAIAKARGEEA